MFHKLRLKLTLINAAVMFVLFVLLTVGTYYYSHQEITHRSEGLAKRIMSGIETGEIQDLPFLPSHHPHQRVSEPDNPPPREEPPHGPSFFFVKASSDGSIQFQSSNQPLALDELNKLVQESLAGSLKGTILLNGTEYPYLKSTSNAEANTVILFQDFSREKNMLQIQLTALIGTGLICIILSFFGSFFMANRAMRPIQTAWQQQKDFLSDASHELRTPLTVIQTNLSIVLDNRNESVASQINWLENIKEESEQMAKLVDNLLFLARSDSNQPLFNKQPLLLNQTVKQALKPFATIAQDKGVALNILIREDLLIDGDESRIAQVISILTDNGIRHTDCGGTLSVHLLKSDNDAVLEVRDTGEGIDPIHLSKIFERFYQVDKARSRGGAGLGLAIAKSIIESHGGSIYVNSAPRVGTTFTIRLPLKKIE